MSFAPLQRDVDDELSDVANSLQIDLDEAWKGLMRKLYERDANRWKS